MAICGKSTAQKALTSLLSGPPPHPTTVDTGRNRDPRTGITPDVTEAEQFRPSRQLNEHELVDSFVSICRHTAVSPYRFRFP